MKAIELLQKAAETGRWSHAYLFIGGEAAVRSLVDFVAQKRGYHPVDISELSGGDAVGKRGEIKIGEIRELIHDLNLSAYKKGRLAVIRNCENLNQSSGNVLLKILEEPPRGAAFILTAGRDSVLPTIKSRCTVIKAEEDAPKISETSVNFLAQGFFEASKEIEKIVKDERTGFFLEALTAELRSILNREKSPRVAGLLKEALEAKQRISQNGNARLILENLSLSFEEVFG